jgi:hypothetical protein
MAAVKLTRRPRCARRNPEGIGGLISDTVATTGGVLVGRFAQNFSAMRLEKGKSPAEAKAQAGKPLYVAIGTVVPVALGLALRKFAKQPRLGNALMVGGLTFGVHELARQFVFSKAPEGSPLYALGDDAELGQVAQGEDGTEWAYVNGRGWHRIDEQRALPPRRLSGLAVRDDLGQDDEGEDMSGLAVRDDLGSFENPRDDFGSTDEWGGSDLQGPYSYGD